LIFVVADERDVILRRTKYGPSQEAHLYRFHASAEELQAACLDYVGQRDGDRPDDLDGWQHVGQ
jgi:hypothetical protein